MLIIEGHRGQLVTVVVVKSHDVVHHTGGISADGGQDEQVLERLVLSEIRVVEHNALEQFDKLVGEVSVDEGTDGKRDLVNILGLRQGSLDNLVNDLLAVRVVLLEDLGPKLLALALDKVASLHAVQVVLVGDLNELIVALAPRALVASECKVRVLVLTVLSDFVAIVELVVDQEGRGVFAASAKVKAFIIFLNSEL